VEANTTAMLDAELAGRMTTSRSGLIARAPTYITQELCDVMDMFNIATGPARAEYKFRAEDVKTPQDGLADSMGLFFGGWELELLKIIRASLQSPRHLDRLFADGDTPRANQNCVDMWDFTLNLLSERAVRIMPAVLDYPHCAVALLAEREQERVEARERAVRDFWLLVDAEKQSLTSPRAWEFILQDIAWKDNMVIRLLLHAVCQEWVNTEAGLFDVGPHTQHVARAMRVHLPDEKPPEDVHQHIRDRQRAKRHKVIPVASIFDAQLGSGVLEARVPNTVSVSEEAVAGSAWRSISERAKSKQSYAARPKDWPVAFNQILNTRRDWPSPGVDGIMNAYITFQWLVNRGGYQPPLPATTASWWSRLIPKHALVFDDGPEACHLVCLRAGNWGFLAARMVPVDGEHVRLEASAGSISVSHLLGPVEVTTDVHPVWLPGVGVVLRLGGNWQSVVHVALRSGRRLSNWELTRRCLRWRRPRLPLLSLELSARCSSWRGWPPRSSQTTGWRWWGSWRGTARREGQRVTRTSSMRRRPN